MKRVLAWLTVLIILTCGLAYADITTLPSTIKEIQSFYEAILQEYCEQYDRNKASILNEKTIELVHQYFIVYEETSMLYLLEQNHYLGLEISVDFLLTSTNFIIDSMKNNWELYKNGENSLESCADYLFTIIEAGFVSKQQGT